MDTKRVGIIVGVMLVLITGIIGCGSQDSTDPVRQKLDQAGKYLNEKNVEQAIMVFNEAIKIDPKSLEAQVGLAQAYISKGDLAEAEKAVTAAKAIGTLTPEQYTEIVQAYLDKEKLKDAGKLLAEAWDKYPDSIIIDSSISKEEAREYQNPEKVVQSYWNACIAGDYKTASENISVWEAFRTMPEEMSPAGPRFKYIVDRSEMEKAYAAWLGQGAAGTELKDVTVKIMPEYTCRGKLTAFVVFKLIQKEKPEDYMVAILEKANGRYYMGDMDSVQPTDLTDENWIQDLKDDVRRSDLEYKKWLAGEL